MRGVREEGEGPSASWHGALGVRIAVAVELVGAPLSFVVRGAEEQRLQRAERDARVRLLRQRGHAGDRGRGHTRAGGIAVAAARSGAAGGADDEIGEPAGNRGAGTAGAEVAARTGERDHAFAVVRIERRPAIVGRAEAE